MNTVFLTLSIQFRVCTLCGHNIVLIAGFYVDIICHLELCVSFSF